jgi:hypothetical protein
MAIRTSVFFGACALECPSAKASVKAIATPAQMARVKAFIIQSSLLSDCRSGARQPDPMADLPAETDYILNCLYMAIVHIANRMQIL